MFFPFSIKYQKSLKGELTNEDKIKAINYIESFIRNKKGNIKSVSENEMSFKTSLFKGHSFDILGPIEKGKFCITQKNVLTYEFFMYRLFVIVTIMSVFVVLITKDMYDGIMCFAWLGGMNWFIALIRHRLMLVSITYEINSMINSNI